MACHAKLVFSRHGESEWNLANKFTGWVDVDLSEKGVGEAKAAGDLIKEEGLEFDVCYTSYLKRAIKTCNLALQSADQLYVPVEKTWRLNERMYGGLTGLDKKETVLKHGAEQVGIWRRSFDLPPPDIDEDSEFHPKLEVKYAGLAPSDIPKSESLKTVIDRVMPYWEQEIKPQLQAGKTVFVAAHGNSIRAIVKFIENIPDDVIPGLEIPTGTPLVYELDKDLNPLPSALAVEPLKYGRYLGDAEKIRAAAEAVKNQTKVADPAPVATYAAAPAYGGPYMQPTVSGGMQATASGSSPKVVNIAPERFAQLAAGVPLTQAEIDAMLAGADAPAEAAEGEASSGAGTPTKKSKKKSLKASKKKTKACC